MTMIPTCGCNHAGSWSLSGGQMDIVELITRHVGLMRMGAGWINVGGGKNEDPTLRELVYHLVNEVENLRDEAKQRAKLTEPVDSNRMVRIVEQSGLADPETLDVIRQCLVRG